MARKTPIDKLDDAINEILEDYVDQVSTSVGEIAEAMAKKGAQTLRSVSRRGFPKGTGTYAKGWTVETKRTRHKQLEKFSTIYNEHAGMPHLLENGHRNVDKMKVEHGRTPAHPHIARVEEKLVEAFEREVLRKL